MMDGYVDDHVRLLRVREDDGHADEVARLGLERMRAQERAQGRLS